MLYELLWREGYKLTVVPNGYVRLQTDYNVKTVPEISTMSYCTQSPTVYPGTKKQCIFIDDVECMQPRGQGWITVTTHIGINTEKRRQTWEKIPSKEPYWVLDKAKSSNVYVANPEGMTIWVDHAAFAPTIGIYGSSRTSKGQMMDTAGKVIRELGGTKDTISLTDLLKCVGRDLDFETLSVLHKGARAREVGMVIAVLIDYTNLNTGGKLVYTMTPRLLEGVNFRQDEATSN